MATRSGISAAEARLKQAKSGWWPRVNYQESWQRSNNPVFVFSSRLMQRRFTEQNFAIDDLNHPDSINNFQSMLTAEQPLFDAGQTRNATRSADLGKQMATEDQRRVELELIARVARIYHGVLLTVDLVKVADETVKSAEADLARAEARLAAGMTTEADVLSIRVHLTAMRETRIRRQADLEVARAALNEAMGVGLDEQHILVTPVSEPGVSKEQATAETQAPAARPEARQARLAVSLAETQVVSARGNYWPQVSLRGGVEADRARFITEGGGSWFAGVSLRWNLFNGGADKAKVEEASHALARARASEQQAIAGVRLEVRRANADLTSARERVSVTAAAVSAAEESLRIVTNRYDNGLNTVTDLLRAETALDEARTRHIAASHDVRLAAVGVEMAMGTLNRNSDVLK